MSANLIAASSQHELDREIENGLHEVAQIRAGLGTSPIRLKLRAKALLP